MNTNPPQKNDGTLGITFTGDAPVVNQPKGFLGNSPADTKSPQSHLTDHNQVFDVGRAFTSNHADTGTIVSDKRRKRASLGENMQSAFHEWWGKTSKKIAQLQDKKVVVAQKPHVVPKVETRSSIVQKAIPQENLPPRDDHKMVVQKIRTFEQDVARVTTKPVVIKKVTTPPQQASWTHVVDTPPEKAPLSPRTPPIQSYPSEPIHHDAGKDLIAPDIDTETRKNTQAALTPPVAEKKIESYMPHMEEVPAIPPSDNKVSIAPSVLHEAPAPRETKEIPLPKIAAPTPSPMPPEEAPLLAKQEKSATPFVIPSSADMALEKAHSAYRQPFHSTTSSQLVMKQSAHIPLQSASTQHIPTRQHDTFTRLFIQIAILGFIVLLGIALAVMAYFYFNTEQEDRDTKSESIHIGTYTFFEIPYRSPILFDSTKQVFLEALSSRIGETSEDIAHFYPTRSIEGGTRLISSQEFFELLVVNLPGKTIRALDNTYTIGSVRTTTNEPFIIIRSYNFDVLFSGLLEWEPTMQQDLAPLFGIPQGTVTTFTDAVRDNKSIRILYNTMGDEVLLYSFVNSHTVIITTSGEALARLISKF